MLQKPSGGAGHGAAATDSGLMSIGAVLNALRDEFPEVTISKIRFLESEGLIEPQRTPSGYRKFSAHDVERLGHVLRMQRDHYLPLKVIREHLEAMERGEALPLPVLGRQRDGEAAPEPPEGPTAARIGRAELLAAAGVDEQELKEWESYGLLTPLEDGAYDAEAVTVALLVIELGRFGIEPRHLRAMKAAADREAGLVDQVVAPLRRHRNPQTRAHAEARTKELAGLTVKLHAALVRTALGVRLP
ncbi:transcriptional regulator FtsR [Streptomyces cahuitamycinicus]|uniref:MerR family transcriptional regulator n=1 Tax=Streptomyces cahuitamycinicus TaxID=2070367 RepID=A0A2N8TPZ9_9ACTN|nr:MerR family transcriptional regulator [Streptomyces cahuitamycinicus]PNG21069.1 MerR family transcriptional regulator [Streptomyces cahuitamycinicus]